MATAQETAQRVAAMPETDKALTLRIKALYGGFHGHRNDAAGAAIQIAVRPF